MQLLDLLYMFAIIVLALPAICVVYAGRVRLVKHPYSIEGVFIFSFLLFYCADLFYSLINYNNSYVISGIGFSFDRENMLKLSAYYFIAAALFVFVLSRGAGRSNSRISENMARAVDGFSHPVPYGLALILIVTSALWLGWMVSKFGFAQYFGNLAVRSLLFSETTMQNAIVSSSISIYTLIISCRYAKHKKKFKAVLDFVPLVVVVVLSGARAPLVEAIFIFMFINNYYSGVGVLKKKVFAFIALGGYALASLALATRVHSDDGVSGVFSKVFGTEQVPQSENGLNLIQSDFRGGSFFIDIFSFIPRVLYESFGLEKGNGANAVYTEHFVRYRWVEQGSQISLGGFNELLMNFGVYFSLIMVFILALLAKRINSLLSSSAVFVLLTPALSWSVFQFMRGDIYHTANKFFTYFMALVVFFIVVQCVGLIKRYY